MKNTSKKNKLISLVTALVTAFALVAFVLPNHSLKASAYGNAWVYAQGYVQNIGWQNVVGEGGICGTVGQSLRLEKIDLYINADAKKYRDSSVRIRTHQANVGWVGYSSAPVNTWIGSGTTGESRAIEAVQIQLTGSLAKDYIIEYRAHVQNIGWMNWVRDNAVAGTTGQGLRMEAIEFRLVPRR